MSQTTARFRYTLPLMIVTLLFAAGIYLANINQVSFWEDESWMAVAVKGDPGHVWTFAAENGLHPPLYFELGWLYTRLTGDGELALRWLAGLCALIGIAFTYRLAADWFGGRAGTYAALLASGSLFLMYFGRLARQYTLFFALAAALVWVYSRWWAQVTSGRKSNRRLLALIVVLQAAVLYTHYFGAWMALVLGLHGLLTLPRWDKARLIGALALSGLVFVPWIPSILLQLHGDSSGLGYASQDIVLNLRAYLDRVFNGDYVLGFTLVLLGAAALIRWRKSSVGLLLGIWLTIPLVLSLLMNTRFPWFVERNMIFTLSGAYALLGAGLAWLSQYRPGRLAGVVAVGLFVVLGFARYDTFWPFITPDWRDMAGIMTQDARPNDLFVLDGEPYSMTYYLDRDLKTSVQMISLKNWLANPTPADRIWLLDQNWKVQDAAHKALPSDSVMTRQYVLGVLVAEFYQRPPQSPLTTFGGQITLGFQQPDALQAYPGAILNLDLWWKAARTPDTDYSVGVYLVDDKGATVTQEDGGFDSGRIPAYALPADRWTPDARTLTLPVSLHPGHYMLTAAVYDWHTGDRLMPDHGWDNRSFPLDAVIVN